ncbi:tail fiber assembly protein [Pantoea sp.]
MAEKYRMVLCRMEVETATEISWPEKPA